MHGEAFFFVALRSTEVTSVATLKVNIGCGTIVASGWINYDTSLNMVFSKYWFLKRLLYTLRLVSRQTYETSWPSGIIRKDVRKGLPLQDETVDFIYCSHFLEHLTHEEAVNLLNECHRVLKRRGWMRVVCPDLRIIVSKYLEGDLDYILFRVSHKSELSQAFIKSLYLSDNRSIFERFLSPGFAHRCMYDFDSLATLLRKCGFGVAEKRRFGEGITPDIDRLDSHPEESLYVEAQKL